MRYWNVPIVGLVATALVSALAPTTPAEQSPRLTALHERFLTHLDTLDDAPDEVVAELRAAWESGETSGSSADRVDGALERLYPEFAAGRRALEASRADEAARALEPLIAANDPFLAANALYYTALAHWQAERADSATALLMGHSRLWLELDALTAHAPELHLMRSFGDARAGHYHAAATALRELLTRYTDADEGFRARVGSLLQRIVGRGLDRLDEAATRMSSAAERLTRGDTGEATRAEQTRVLTVLDELIAQAEQQMTPPQSKPKPTPAPSPQEGQSKPEQAAKESTERTGPGQTAELGDAPQAQPGAAWGKLPPAERERVLQAIGERHPSRYRQLVEQYYRALAEEP